MKLLIVLIIIFFLSSCANYSHMCNANSSEGWHLYRKPTPEMLSIFKAEESKGGEIKWFKNKDGRIRICEAYPKHDCASYYKTHTPSSAKEDELVISSCPNPY